MVPSKAITITFITQTVVVITIVIVIVIVIVLVINITTTQRGGQARDGGRITGQDPLLRPEGSHRPCSQVDHCQNHSHYKHHHRPYIFWH